MDYFYAKTEITNEKILAYSKLLSLVFIGTNKFTYEFLYWQYAQNPEGMVVGFDAFYNKELIAHYVTIPVTYLINGKKTKGLLSLNTAVHPKHQGKKLFTQLAEKTYEEGKKLGYQFVIGVANQNSTHGFLKKLGFYLISPLQVRVGMGEMQLDKTHQYVAQPHWSNESYQWRLSNPTTSYLIKRNHIYARINKFGLYAQLCDLKHFANLEFNLKRCNPIFKILIGLATIRKENGFFIELPKRLKPSPLNLVFKDLNTNLPTLKAQDIFFELIDFDAY